MMWCRDFQIDTLSSIWHCFFFLACVDASLSFACGFVHRTSLEGYHMFSLLSAMLVWLKSFAVTLNLGALFAIVRQ